MTRRYLVVYENGRGNWSGFAPDVRGCASTGATVEELRSNSAKLWNSIWKDCYWTDPCGGSAGRWGCGVDRSYVAGA